MKSQIKFLILLLVDIFFLIFFYDIFSFLKSIDIIIENIYFLGTQELIITHQSIFVMKLETQKYLINEISH